jgi:membrane protease YdiL (CAAX protease family)
LHVLGNPAYEGVWILVPHALLYSTLGALVCLALWIAFVRAKWLAPMPLALSRAVVAWGVAAALVTAAGTFGFLAATQPGALHAPRFDAWLAAANLFSNLYEELIFRGFVLAALTAVFGFWPAALLSSLAFAVTHSQYPLALQALIATCGLFWCWIVRRTRSLWSSWIAHVGLDWMVDPFL